MKYVKTLTTVLFAFALTSPTNSLTKRGEAAPRVVHVLDASSLVSNAHGMPVAVDSALELIMKPQSGKSLATRPFQIRLFRGNLAELQSSPWAEEGDCFVYITTVLKFDQGPFDARFVVAAVDKFWLSIKSSQLASQPYVLMFEDRSIEDSILRIKKADVAEYFRNSYYFVVNPRRPLSAEEADEVYRYFKDRGKSISDRVREGIRDCITFRGAQRVEADELELASARTGACDENSG